MKGTGDVWIFGYGSLVWRPAFPALESRRAWLPGHQRRFWQGSTDHRGIPGRPGRVVTLVADDHPDLVRESHAEEGSIASDGDRVAGRLGRRGASCSAGASVCAGRAYRVAACDAAAVLAQLDHRERGGYTRRALEFELAGESAERERVVGAVYVAAAENEAYLGPAPLLAMARQIAAASGPSGRNDEYVFELATSLRRLGSADAHVFALEAALRSLAGPVSGRGGGTASDGFRR